MSEFADIFADQATTTLFVYGSIALLAICAFAAIWISSRVNERGVSPARLAAA